MRQRKAWSTCPDHLGARALGRTGEVTHDGRAEIHAHFVPNERPRVAGGGFVPVGPFAWIRKASSDGALRTASRRKAFRQSASRATYARGQELGANVGRLFGRLFRLGPKEPAARPGASVLLRVPVMAHLLPFSRFVGQRTGSAGRRPHAFVGTDPAQGADTMLLRTTLVAALSAVASLAFAAGCSGTATDGQTSSSECCPPDTKMSGSMYLGGKAHDDGTCHQTYDFWCSTNWRIEKDAAGCQVWRYDIRSPSAGETFQCQPQRP